MGLRSFHIFFIFVSALMCVGIASWQADSFMNTGGTWTLVHALAWAAAGLGLLIYDVGFVRKSKELISL
jgi:hypothetical protein